MKLKIKAIFFIFIISIISISYILFYNIHLSLLKTCSDDDFYSNTLKSCHPLLTCKDLRDIEIHNMIGLGGVKVVYHAEWRNMDIVLSQLNNPKFSSDFIHGLNMLKKYKSDDRVVNLIGYCNKKHVILTEYFPLGNAVHITDKLNNYTKGHDNLLVRLRLCLNYAKILELLHDPDLGVTVNCDSNDLNKLLSQLLVSNDLQLILNDVDSLAEIKQNETIKCGSRQLLGNFVAPEQLWNSKAPFSDADFIGYDEKSDIWKAASVCDYFIGNVKDSLTAKYWLFELHRDCKNRDPKLRPTAKHLVEQYSIILNEIDKTINLDLK